MRIINKIYFALCALLLTACGTEDIDGGQKALRLTVPVQLTTANANYLTSRATGDPGIDDELAPPANLYVFAWMQSSPSRYELYYTSRTGLTADDWTYLIGSDAEDQDSRYQLNTQLELPFQSSVTEADDGDMVGRVYAIATTRPLTNAQLQAVAGYYQAALTSPTSIIVDSSPEASFEMATASFEDWSSEDLRDLYSNPIDDTATDANGIGNGKIVYDSSVDDRARCGTVRLYHCAAKVDFTWEMDASLITSESVNSIVIHELPTSCSLFAPTYNPDDIYREETITTDVDTKWIGREYRYVLQPSIGDISYSVYFNEGRDPTSMMFSPVTINRVFTGWYRIVAKVKPL